MRERITAKHLRRLLPIFCKELGFKQSEHFSEPGYKLDHYRGWRITYQLESGGESDRFGSGRHTARELFDQMHFAINIARVKRNEATQ